MIPTNIACRCACITAYVLISLEDDILSFDNLSEIERIRFLNSVQADDQFVKEFDSFAELLLDIEHQCSSDQFAKDKWVGEFQQQIADDFLSEFDLSLCPHSPEVGSEIFRTFERYAAYYSSVVFFINSFVKFISEAGLPSSSSLTQNRINELSTFTSQIPSLIQKIGTLCGIESGTCVDVTEKCRSSEKKVNSLWSKYLELAIERVMEQ